MSQEKIEPNTGERYHELEQSKERIREIIRDAYARMTEHGESIGSLLGRMGRRESNINQLMSEIKGEAEEEATKLNEQYDQLIEKAMKALTDLHDFEVNELGIKDSSAVETEL